MASNKTSLNSKNVKNPLFSTGIANFPVEEFTQGVVLVPPPKESEQLLTKGLGGEVDRFLGQDVTDLGLSQIPSAELVETEKQLPRLLPPPPPTTTTSNFRAPPRVIGVRPAIPLPITKPLQESEPDFKQIPLDDSVPLYNPSAVLRSTLRENSQELNPKPLEGNVPLYDPSRVGSVPHHAKRQPSQRVDRSPAPTPAALDPAFTSLSKHISTCSPSLVIDTSPLESSTGYFAPPLSAPSRKSSSSSSTNEIPPTVEKKFLDQHTTTSISSSTSSPLIYHFPNPLKTSPSLPLQPPQSSNNSSIFPPSPLNSFTAPSQINSSFTSIPSQPLYSSPPSLADTLAPCPLPASSPSSSTSTGPPLLTSATFPPSLAPSASLVSPSSALLYPSTSTSSVPPPSVLPASKAFTPSALPESASPLVPTYSTSGAFSSSFILNQPHVPVSATSQASSASVLSPQTTSFTDNSEAASRSSSTVTVPTSSFQNFFNPLNLFKRDTSPSIIPEVPNNLPPVAIGVDTTVRKSPGVISVLSPGGNPPPAVNSQPIPPFSSSPVANTSAPPASLPPPPLSGFQSSATPLTSLTNVHHAQSANPYSIHSKKKATSTLFRPEHYFTPIPVSEIPKVNSEETHLPTSIANQNQVPLFSKDLIPNSQVSSLPVVPADVSGDAEVSLASPESLPFSPAVSPEAVPLQSSAFSPSLPLTSQSPQAVVSPSLPVFQAANQPPQGPPPPASSPANSYRLSTLKRPTYAPVPDLSFSSRPNVMAYHQEAFNSVNQGVFQPRIVETHANIESSPPVMSNAPPTFQPFTAMAVSQTYRPVYHHWFYRRGDDKKNQWSPFSMADSLNLEQQFSTDVKSETGVVATDGGRYDVEVEGRKRNAVYWHEDEGEVRRCSWFVRGPMDSRYIPYDENIAALLEEEYKAACTRNEWNRRVELADGEVIIIHSPNAIIHHQRSSSPDPWGNPPAMQDKPRVVKRGLDEFDIPEGEPTQVDHLVLLVHGIGKVCDLRFRSLVEVVDDFRSISVSLIGSHYKSAVEKGKAGRVEVLPVEWHRALHTDAIDQRLADITLPSIPKARQFTNETLLDILFYTSPVFCERIVQAVGAEVNRVYSLYMERNPGYKGGISLGGHSLGSLILFDMLCHQKPHPKLYSSPSFSFDEGDEDVPSLGCLKTRAKLSRRMSYLTMGTAGTGQPFIVYPQLKFQPRAFFALGSPIGMFVTVRGIESLGEEFRFPTCPSFYNIFHPNDPVAYRIEGLINPEMAHQPAVLIPHHKGRKRMHLELKETMAHVTAALKQKLLDSVKNTWNTVYSLTRFSKIDQKSIENQVDKAIEDEMLCKERSDDGSSVGESGDDGTTEMKVGVLNGGRRIDYVLQEAPLETFNQYISAVRSHLVYWESEDTLLLMLKEVYGAKGITADCQVSQPILPFDLTAEANADPGTAYSHYTVSTTPPPSREHTITEESL